MSEETIAALQGDIRDINSRFNALEEQMASMAKHLERSTDIMAKHFEHSTKLNQYPHTSGFKIYK